MCGLEEIFKSMDFAKAVQGLKNEGAYAVLAAATALEKEGRDIVHFEIGQPDYPTPPHIVMVRVRSRLFFSLLPTPHQKTDFFTNLFFCSLRCCYLV